MITPSAYFACREEGIPVIQSLHNFRLLCSNGLFYRNHMVCEECLNKTLWRGVYHRCYKNSRLITAAVVWMLEKHWKQRTWLDMVDFYIVASEFTRQKYIEGGIPPEKIAVKPNFVYPDRGIREKNGSYALYVGRLSDEKGIGILLEAWRSIQNFPLRVIGDGPLIDRLKKYVTEFNMKNIEFLGFANQAKYENNMKNARFLVVPSQCYESFPRIIAEAFSYGIPILTSRLGSLEEIIEEGKTGVLFKPGDISDLIGKINWMINHEDDLLTMGRDARREFEKKYSAQKNYEQLIEIYEKATTMPREASDAKARD